MSTTVVVKQMDSDEEEYHSHQEECESMDLPANVTSVTIVEEDGSTSIVEDASVSSVLTDAGPNSSIQFSHTQSGGLTYRVVGLDEQTTFTNPTSSGVQLLSSPINGQYYVIGSPQDVMARPRSAQIIDARTLSRVAVTSKAIVRDEKKRATHNEVERRRRDKINGWINKLAKIVPTCVEENSNSKIGQSKGGILAKACEYIHELRSTNIRLATTLKDHENSIEDAASLRRENLELRRENSQLRQELGIVDDEESTVIITSDLLIPH